MAHQFTSLEAAIVGMQEFNHLRGATLVETDSGMSLLRRKVSTERLAFQLRCLAGSILLVIVVLCLRPASADHYALPADWQMKGFVAALDDSHANTVAFALHSTSAAAIFHAMGHGPQSFQEHAKEQVPALVELLSDRYPARVQEAAAEALAELGDHAREALPQLVELLRKSDRDVRWAAVKALGQLEEHAREVVSRLVEILRDASLGPHVREAVADVLWRVEEHTENALTEIVMLLQNESWRVRELAVRALGRLGEDAKTAVRELAEMVGDDDEKVRGEVIRALGKLGEHAKETVPRLIELLRGEGTKPYVQEYAAYALGMLGVHAKEAVPGLLLLLSSQEVDVRAAAVWSLGQLWVHNKEVAPELPMELFELLSIDEQQVREAAIKALAQIASHADEAVSWPAEKLVHLLRDNRRRVRDAAVYAFEDLAAKVDEVVPELAKLLRERGADSRARAAAADSLGGLGGLARDAVPILVEAIADREGEVRAAAANALGKLGEHAREALPGLVELLRHRESDVCESASRAIGELKEYADGAIPELVRLMSHDKWHVRESAAEALEDLAGEVTASPAGLVTELTTLMRDMASQQTVRVAAAKLLGGFGAYAKQAVPDLVRVMEGRNWRLKGAAAESLGRLGEHAREAVPDLAKRLAKLLTHERPSVRLRAVYALGGLGEHARAEAPKLAGLLIDEDWETSDAVVEVLEAIGPFPVQTMPSILIHAFADTSRIGEIRFRAHFLGGGNEEVKRLLAWLRVPVDKLVEEFGHRNDASEALAVFKIIWDSTAGYRALRRDLGSRIAVILTGDWAVGRDAEELIGFEKALRVAGLSNEASVVTQLLHDINRIELLQRWGVKVGGILVVHAAFWSLLIFVYPWSPQCQAFFFWNRWIRRLFGLGYVGCLLTWVPFLRRRLFVPFKCSLLADAKLDLFDEKNYFGESVVWLHDQTLCPIAEALPRILGQVVLEGESGLGKSMFLRQLVKSQGELTVFLLAVDCKHGVEEAIQKKLEGPARDPDYIRKLIYAGTLRIVIDGLNEISVDTRTRIVEFARRFSKGNLLMATQPMVWEPPSTANVYRIQRLNETQMEEFLVSRFDTLSSHTEMTIDSYTHRCRSYIRDSLFDRQFPAKREAMERVLSNPMDLTVVAELIAGGKEPDLFQLQQQHFELMLIDYNYRQAGEIPFPAKKFAECVYEKTKAEDTAVFSEGEFEAELTVLSDHKMVVEFHRAASGAKQFWTFRHDKIRDFFLVQTLLGNRDRRIQHFSDPRFHGVYMQLAYSMPLAEAETLERELINFAAETGDHSVSDDFIKLLESRKAMQRP